MSEFTQETIKNYISSLGVNIPILQTYIEYIYFFLNPYYDTIKNTKTISETKNIISSWTPEIDSELLKFAIKTADDFVSDVSNSQIKNQTFIDEVMNYIVLQILESSLKYVTGTATEFYTEYKRVRRNTSLSPNDFFLGIFSDYELRWFLLHIMPSYYEEKSHLEYAKSQIRLYKLSPNKDTTYVIAYFITYLRKIYQKDYYVLQNNIRMQFNLPNDELDPVIYTLIENIKNKKWDLNKSMYYIISLYDNSLIDYSTALKTIITN